MSTRRWLGPGIVALTFLVGLAATWLRWGDPIVDTGQQLYVAWRLSEGAVFLREVSYYYGGPLAPHVDAAVFRIFGASVLSFVLANAVGVLLLAAVGYALLARCCGRDVATVGALLFLSISVFARPGPVGSFSFLMPYAQDVSHGVLLGVLALGAIARLARSPTAERSPWLLVAGGLAGASLLTKPEIAVAVVPASALGVALSARPRDRDGARRVALRFAAALAAPVVVALVTLALRSSLPEAARACLGSWPVLLAGTVPGLQIFRWGMGTADPAASLARMLPPAAVAIVLAAAAVAADRRLSRASTERRRRVARVVGLAGFVLFAALASRIDLADAWRPLPLYLLVIAGGAALSLRRASRAGDEEARARAVLALTAAVLALGLLGKMLLNARVYHYGFALAMPGVVVTYAALASGSCGRFRRGDDGGGEVRTAMATALALAFAVHLTLHSAPWLERQSFVLGEGADRIRVDAERGPILAEVVDVVERLTGPEDTVLAVPEGAMINYLARRPTPTAHMSFLPPELAAFGELAILEALRASPPELVLVVHRPTPEFGLPVFGRDYGELLATWIRSRYRPVVRLGAPPFEGARFGVEILARHGPPENAADVSR